MFYFQSLTAVSVSAESSTTPPSAVIQSEIAAKCKELSEGRKARRQAAEKVRFQIQNKFYRLYLLYIHTYIGILNHYVDCRRARRMATAYLVDTTISHE